MAQGRSSSSVRVNNELISQLSDHGLADVIISGKGISVEAEIESVENRRADVFRVTKVHVDIDHMTFKIRDSKRMSAQFPLIFNFELM